MVGVDRRDGSQGVGRLLFVKFEKRWWVEKGVCGGLGGVFVLGTLV